MENVITEKRGLVLILVIATVFIFVGLVWAIATYLPLNILGIPSPSFTAAAPVAGKNCTYPVSYWQKHPELYPAQLVIGGQVYKAKDIKGMFSDETQDTPVQLQAQLTGAYLNFLSGADQSYVETTIFEAYGWLVKHPVGSELTDSERVAGTRLFNILETFNQGLTEVAPCEPALTLTLTEASTAIETLTILSTVTPSETVTPTPSETSTPTRTSTGTIRTVITPSRTPIPTTGLPGYPSLTPSRTLAPSLTPSRTFIPSATNTPIDTTEAPTPTETQTPTPIPTKTSTLTPTPTITPTRTPTPTKTSTRTPTLPPTSSPTSTLIPSPTLPPPS